MDSKDAGSRDGWKRRNMTEKALEVCTTPRYEDGTDGRLGGRTGSGHRGTGDSL